MKHLKTSSLHLKPTADVTVWNPHKTILNTNFIGKAIVECLLSNDPEGAMEVIDIYLEALTTVKKPARTKISQEVPYHSLKGKNPTIRTLAKLMHTASVAHIIKK